ncbi:hypothetical protein N9M41_01175 [Rhodopirellula sp.]|nr:hypothetical protein [Rhodopirellula sp.]
MTDSQLVGVSGIEWFWSHQKIEEHLTAWLTDVLRRRVAAIAFSIAHRGM